MKYHHYLISYDTWIKFNTINMVLLYNNILYLNLIDWYFMEIKIYILLVYIKGYQSDFGYLLYKILIYHN